jgi:hypothetical protein
MASRETVTEIPTKGPVWPNKPQLFPPIEPNVELVRGIYVTLQLYFLWKLTLTKNDDNDYLYPTRMLCHGNDTQLARTAEIMVEVAVR